MRIDAARDRSHRRGRTPAHRGRSPSGVGRARARRHRPPHRGARARGQHQLGRVRARQHQRRADRAPDRGAALSHGRLGRAVARPRPARASPASRSSGDRPERQDSATADIFRITLDPGTVITYVLELRSDKLPQLYLWEPDAYKDKVNSFTLYHGIVIGIAGLLALFLTILFVVKGSVMFPAAAALGWAVLVYIGIDFGFWGKVFDAVGRRRADLARIGRGDPRGDAAGVPVRLSQPQPLARALCPHHRWRGSPSSARWSRLRCSIRRVASGHRAHLARAGRGARLRASWSICRPTASTAPCC